MNQPKPRVAEMRRSHKIIIWSFAGLLAMLTLLGAYALFFGERVQPLSDISSWEWFTADEGRVAMLLPAGGISLHEPDGAPAFGTPEGILPYIRLIRLGKATPPDNDTQLEQRLKNLLTSVTASEKQLKPPAFVKESETSAYAEVVTEPQQGLLSCTRAFMRDGELYCAYITTIGERGDMLLMELFDVFFDSIEVQPT